MLPVTADSIFWVMETSSGGSSLSLRGLDMFVRVVESWFGGNLS